MAESIVQVTEGSGKKLHTWNRTIGANSVEDEYVLLGENALATTVLNTIHNATISTATANSHLLQIMAGASNKVRIRRIEMWQAVMATAAAIMDLRMYRLTTAGTGGTVIGSSVLDPTDGAAGFTAMSLPTVKGTEGAALMAGMPYMMQTLGASTPPINPVVVWDFDRLRSKPLIISAGATNGIAIKNISAVAAGQVSFSVWIDESSF
jgi:hypothetical protein